MPSRRFLAAALGAGLALGAPASALAHTELDRTSPRAGAAVARLPATLSLTFDDPLHSVVRVLVLDAKGRDHTVSERLNPRNAAQVLVRTRQSRPGAYRVYWTVRGLDGHQLSGQYRFRVRA